ncbi:hypothetical protein NDU88_005109 [Pleurodeles waltl]|uniref:Uncharacterized protein n=1 Tax=Pleurodeles waltl TaxID=8319 RepID=A0AAV7W9T5_PLEWA|nr:hypothetical protein NDU88_005109 [Pleurodeles waltl]
MQNKRILLAARSDASESRDQEDRGIGPGAVVRPTGGVPYVRVWRCPCIRSRRPRMPASPEDETWGRISGRHCGWACWQKITGRLPACAVASVLAAHAGPGGQFKTPLANIEVRPHADVLCPPAAGGPTLHNRMAA